MGPSLVRRPQVEGNQLHLLLVNGRAADLFAVGISRRGRYGARLAVGRDGHSAIRDDLAISLRGKRQSVVVDHLVGAALRQCVVTAGWVVFSIKLAGPDVVHGLAVGRCTFDRDLDLIAAWLVSNGRVLSCAGRKF